MSRKRGRSKERIPEKCKPQNRNTFSRAGEKFKWSFDKCLWGKVPWRKDIHWFADEIISKLKHYEDITWNEVESASGGKAQGNGSNNHFLTPDALTREAIKILGDIIRDYEKVFSLRLTNVERLIGVVEGAVFYILYYDDRHFTAKNSKR